MTNAASPKIDIEYLGTLAVLYVEDAEMTREALAYYLRRRLGRLDVAGNGKEGLALFDNNHYDLVLTDIRMPFMDGLEMAKSIKAARPDIPVIVLTAHGEADYVARAEAIGIERYLKKPVLPEKLTQEIHDLMQARRPAR